MSLIDVYQQLFGKNHIQDGDVIDMAEHGRVGGVSTGQGFKFVQPVNASGEVISNETLESLVDELSSIANSLKFLSGLQTPNAELRVAINGLVNNGYTMAALSNQTNIGGFSASVAMPSQINTNVATALRANIVIT